MEREHLQRPPSIAEQQERLSADAAPLVQRPPFCTVFQRQQQLPGGAAQEKQLQAGRVVRVVTRSFAVAATSEWYGWAIATRASWRVQQRSAAVKAAGYSWRVSSVWALQALSECTSLGFQMSFDRYTSDFQVSFKQAEF